MRIRKSLVPATVLAVAAGLTLAAGAWARGSGGFGHGLERAVETLELDEARRAEVFAVIDAARPTSRQLREQLRAAHQEMRALLADANASEDAVLAKADAIGALHTELRKHELRTLLQVRARLTPEQQARLAEAMSRRHWKHGGREERRHVL